MSKDGNGEIDQGEMEEVFSKLCRIVNCEQQEVSINFFDLLLVFVIVFVLSLYCLCLVFALCLPCVCLVFALSLSLSSLTS